MAARAKAQHPPELSFPEAYPRLAFLSVSCLGQSGAPAQLSSCCSAVRSQSWFKNSPPAIGQRLALSPGEEKHLLVGCQAVRDSGDENEQPQLSSPSWVLQSVQSDLKSVTAEIQRPPCREGHWTAPCPRWGLNSPPGDQD